MLAVSILTLRSSRSHLRHKLGKNMTQYYGTGRRKAAKARVYIEAKDYVKAIALLDDIHNDENITSQQKNIVDELMSYISHIQ